MTSANMRKMVLAVAATALGCVSASAAPDVVVTSVSQSDSRMLTVNYNLSGEDAVVTLGIETNTQADASGEWVSIGAENIKFVSGDANRKVTAGTGKTIMWAARKSWPDHNIKTPTVRAVVRAWALTEPPDYMVLDLKGSKVVRYYEDVRQLPAANGIDDDLYRTSELVMRRVHAKNVEWYMGSPSTELGRNTTDWDALETRHAVTLTNDYYLAVFELTGKQYENVVGTKVDAGYEMKPVRSITWNQMRGSLDWPSGRHNLTSGDLQTFRTKTGITSFDLPTEAQWEFACRAGTTSALYNGCELTATDVCPNLGKIAWYNGNSDSSLHRVGEKDPNAWGFYDMCGNAAEYCLDWFAVNLGSASVIEPDGAAEGTCRSVRGGRFSSDAKLCRSASRENWLKPTDAKSHTSFRLWCACRAE